MQPHWVSSQSVRRRNVMVDRDDKCLLCGNPVGRKKKNQYCKPCLLARPCKQCGKPLNSIDTRKITCSNECGYRNRLKEKIDVPCLICGKIVTRYKHAMEKFSGACCSIECQRQWSMLERKSKGRKPNWHTRSQNAKRLYKSKSRLIRRGQSKGLLWWRKCKQAASDIESVFIRTDWDVKFNSAAVCLRTRSLRHKRRFKKKCKANWNLTFLSAMDLLRSKTAARLRTGWDAKFNSVASNIRKRMKG